VAAVLAMAAIGVWAVLTGQVSYVVTEGVSMNPVYYQGDLVFVAKGGDYRSGEIAAYRPPGQNVKILHRIIGGDPTTGFVFKGDNNQSIDPFHPRADQVLGRAVLHVPHGGVWLKPLLSPTGLGMMGFLVASGGAMLPRNRREIPRGRRKKKVKAMSRQGNSLATVLTAVQRMSPRMRTASGVVAFLACLAVLLGVLGWMKPLLVRELSTERAQSMTFSYSAKVRPSPAYDGTVAASPDPIFRRLAEHVDLKMHYDGISGTIAATATLSTSNGWHTAMSLATAKQFSGSSVDTIATLDLKAMSDRAADAAAAIGTPVSGVMIAVDAAVTSGTAAPFHATLNLQLDALQLKLAGSAGSLMVSNAPPATIVPRSIGFMTASQARAYAVLLFLVAAVGAAAIAFAVRRRVPLRTRAEIEHRYAAVLVPVEPMPSPPGKPVVNVDNFPALVRLAERYGQMILTWRRPDADDFVVRDEGITYRYRVPLEEPILHNVEMIDRNGTHRRRASSEVS
jgi:signal peptidase I